MKNLLYLLLAGTIIASCHSEKNETSRDAIRSLAECHVADMKLRPLIDELLLSVDNDTNKICFALVMPKKSLIRLTKDETKPSGGCLQRIKDLLIHRYADGMAYVDSLADGGNDDKDWLLNSSACELPVPLWEQYVE